MEQILGGAGRIVVVDQDSQVLKHLDLGEGLTAPAETGKGAE